MFATEKLKVWCAVKAVCMGLQGIHSFLVQFYDTTFSFFCIFPHLYVIFVILMFYVLLEATFEEQVGTAQKIRN